MLQERRINRHREGEERDEGGENDWDQHRSQTQDCLREEQGLSVCGLSK